MSEKYVPVKAAFPLLYTAPPFPVETQSVICPPTKVTFPLEYTPAPSPALQPATDELVKLSVPLENTAPPFVAVQADIPVPMRSAVPSL